MLWVWYLFCDDVFEDIVVSECCIVEEMVRVEGKLE